MKRVRITPAPFFDCHWRTPGKAQPEAKSLFPSILQVSPLNPKIWRQFLSDPMIPKEATTKKIRANGATGVLPVQVYDAPATCYCFPVPVQRSTQSLTVFHQSCEFCGFSTQWPSSGK